MSKINLLPWRQERRKLRQQEFVAIVAGVAVIAVALVLFAHMALSKQMSDQDEKNVYIRGEITRLDGQIKEIDELQKRRDELLARMKVIQDLQGYRPVIVRVFDELVRVLPEGVFIRNLTRQGDSFTMNGTAESPTQVSAFMRNLDASPWFKSPVLSTVSAEQGTAAATTKAAADKQQANKFALTVSLETPAKPDEAAAQQGAQ